MKAGLSSSLLDRLSTLVSGRMGLLFPPDRWADLERGLRSAAGEFGFDDVAACAEWLASSALTRAQIEMLASHLTVGETYFFREKAAFRALEERVFPELIRAKPAEARRRLRVWSAGCCTGEEPYSVAMLLTKLLPDLAQWDITVLGTDINPRFLAKGAKGEYGEWSFRDAPAALKDQFFTNAAKGGHSVVPRVKEMVTFDYLNLVDDVYPSLLNNTNAMDVILCRNVLIYLGPEQSARLVARLCCSLTEGGWLFVGAAETSLVSGRELASVALPGVTAFQKRPAPVPPTQPPVQDQSAPSHGAPSIPRPQAVEPMPMITVVAVEAPAVSPLAAARALYEQGHYAAAAERLTAFCTATPTGAEAPAAMALLARAYANLGDLSQALHWCDAAVAGDKLSARLHYLRAVILQEKPDVDEAAAALRRAIYLDPDFVMAHFALALLSRRRGKDTDVPRQLNQAREMLRNYGPQDVLPESEGITAARLADIIDATVAGTLPTASAGKEFAP